MVRQDKYSHVYGTKQLRNEMQVDEMSDKLAQQLRGQQG
jgi:hypothetical protein